MRAALALLCAIVVLVSAAAPHHHSGPFGNHECAACLMGSSEAASPPITDLAPRAVPVGDPEQPIDVAVASGAPLGAIPGQSPPPA